MTNLTDLTLQQARAGLRNKDFTSVELTDAYIKASENARDLNIYITETFDVACEQAKQSDTLLAKGQGGLMQGIPIGMKDLFCTNGIRTTAGSAILENFVPTYESFVSQKLWDNGAICLGKLNLDEFAMGGANLTSHYGAVKNPWKRRGDDTHLVPGGSSGGSSAAIASGAVLAATGTDTGGSIRQPASFTGIVGMKPTYGRCSRWGIVAFASSLDQAGAMARNVHDTAIMLESMCGFDAMDGTSADIEVPNFESVLGQDIKGMKIGVPKEYRVDGMDSQIEKIWQQGIAWLQDAGAKTIDISLPHTQYALPTYYIVAPAEASSNLARYDGVRYGVRHEGDDLIEMYENTRAKGFGDEVRRRIMIGTYTLSAGYYDAYYKKAQQVRTLICQDFINAYEQCDLILTPTAPSGAFGMNEKQDPIAMYMGDVFTVPASLAGLPAISVPAGLNSDGLPLGLQLIGKPFDESTVLKAAHHLEVGATFTEKPKFYVG